MGNRHIVVSPDVHKQAKVNAAKDDKSVKEYIAELVQKDTDKKQHSPQQKKASK